MNCKVYLIVVLLLIATFVGTTAKDTDILEFPNSGFEKVNTVTKLPEGWEIGIAPNTKATIQLDETVKYSGRYSIKITDQSPTAPFIYALLKSQSILVHPETTYDINFYAKAQNLKNCYVGVDLEAGDTYREYLPVGTYDWQPITLTVATQPNQKKINIHFVADGITDGLWIDDVSISISPRQLAGLTERQYPKDFLGPFPRSQGEVSRHLLVCDTYKLSSESIRPLVALQGIVNRKNPSIYLINNTLDPPYIDEKWLAYMKEKGYTDQEERVSDPVELISRFRNEITGLIIIDPELPGSINASWMLAGLRNALPVSPEMAQTLSRKLNLPVVIDLRGMWKRNVDAYRYIYDNYWDQMNHYVLGWQFPPSKRFCTQDYLVEFKVFQFWVSNPIDNEKGSDYKAELAFAHEILANTPGNIPIFGWVGADEPTYVWLTEYMFSHLVSEYGKFIANTSLNSNASVHSAIQLKGEDNVFKQKSHERLSNIKLEKEKVYVTFSIMDCDGTACWQGWWQRIFADPLRGSVPMGYGMSFITIDLMPLVLRWYYEHMTANETFYALVYFNEPIYANRFRKEDRERIWNQWMQYFNKRCQMLDLNGVEVLWSGVHRPNLPKEGVLKRYTQGIKNLNYIMAEISRDTRVEIPTDECTYMLDNTVVSHTVNHFHIWGGNENLSERKMESENAFILDDLKKVAPQKRPAFINIAGYCWGYNATWVMNLKQKLPSDYILVSPDDFARLFRESQKTVGK